MMMENYDSASLPTGGEGNDGDRGAADRDEPGAQSGDSGPPSLEARCPPRPPLVLHVGVTGHRPDPAKRPNPDVAALNTTIRLVLGRIQDAFEGVAHTHGRLFAPADDPIERNRPRLRVISSLAEGSDQWVVEEAMNLGYELQAPLPFERSIYRSVDFATDSAALAGLKRMLEAASAVFELDGDTENAGMSYRAVGRVVLNQSDILIAIWDGKEAMGTGGTGQIVREAIEGGLPVVWIKWTDPKTWGLLEPKWRLLESFREIEGDWDRLSDCVRRILLPAEQPYAAARTCPPDLRESYFGESRRRCPCTGGLWGAFRNLVAASGVWRAFRDDADREGWRTAYRKLLAEIRSWMPKSERLSVGDTIKKWREDRRKTEIPPFQAAEWADKTVGPHYAWANFLSVCYGGFYRSSYLCNYLLGATAVFLALLGFLLGRSQGSWVWGVLAEAVLIGMILIITYRGRRRRWHERWIDYRTLAERLRLLRFLALLGGTRQPSSLPPHLATYGNPANTWMLWHFRAVERALGLPHAVVNGEYLEKTRLVLSKELILGQENYHTENATRMTRVDHRLHRGASALFVLTFVACAGHLSLDWLAHDSSPDWLLRGLVFVNAAFPALAAALAAIRTHGEFYRVEQRSVAMVDELRGLKLELNSVPTRPNELNSVRMRAIAEQVAQVMVNETLDWRVVFKDRPLTLPA